MILYTPEITPDDDLAKTEFAKSNNSNSVHEDEVPKEIPKISLPMLDEDSTDDVTPKTGRLISTFCAMKKF